MQAVICLEPGRLALVERPVPVAAPGWVPVDIKAIGICGTDFHIFEGKHPFLEYPRIMGHELSGIVAEGAPARRPAAGHAGHRQPLYRLRRPASPAARASRTAARA